MLIFFILFTAFDSNSCRSKCQTLFADSPKKKSLCFSTCANGFYEREKLEDDHRQTKDETKNCLERCSENKTIASDFTHWLKCRKNCFNVPNSQDVEFFQPEKCRSECKKHWKGTSHYSTCIDECEKFNKGMEQKKVAQKGTDNQKARSRIFNIW